MKLRTSFRNLMHVLGILSILIAFFILSASPTIIKAQDQSENNPNTESYITIDKVFDSVLNDAIKEFATANNSNPPNPVETTTVLVPQTDDSLTIICPADITAQADSFMPNAVVNYEVTATSPTGSANITSSPTSGAVFELGATTVTASATDFSGARSECSFVVEVIPPAPTNAKCAQKAGADSYAQSAGGHLLWLPEIVANRSDQFIADGESVQFNEYGNWSTLTGYVIDKDDATSGWVIDATFINRIGPPPINPKLELKNEAYAAYGGPVNPNTWHQYDTFSATVEGFGIYAGTLLELIPYGPDFQVGVGAGNKNIGYGGATWFIWTVKSPPIDPNVILRDVVVGDFNFNLRDCEDEPELVTNVTLGKMWVDELGLELGAPDGASLSITIRSENNQTMTCLMTNGSLDCDVPSLTVPTGSKIFVSETPSTTDSWQNMSGLGEYVVTGDNYQQIVVNQILPEPTYSLTITKTIDPFDAQYNQQVSFESDQLPDLNGDIAGDIHMQSLGGFWTIYDLNSGVYTITELVPDGWDLTNVSCNQQAINILNGDTISVELTNSDVTCTFTNSLEQEEPEESEEPENPEPSDPPQLADCPVLDFEGLPAGTLVSDQYPNMTISGSAFGAMIFDTSNPTGEDEDLGAPNNQFGGPGIGIGGSWADINDAPLGKVLIISEDGDTNDPDDKWNGGTLTFQFDEAKYLDTVSLLDVEEAGGSITLYNQDSWLGEVTIPQVGDNSFQIVEIGLNYVTKLEINFVGSAAVAEVICEDPRTEPILLVEQPNNDQPVEELLVNENSQSNSVAQTSVEEQSIEQQANIEEPLIEEEEQPNQPSEEPSNDEQQTIIDEQPPLETQSIAPEPSVDDQPTEELSSDEQQTIIDEQPPLETQAIAPEPSANEQPTEEASNDAEQAVEEESIVEEQPVTSNEEAIED